MTKPDIPLPLRSALPATLPLFLGTVAYFLIGEQEKTTLPSQQVVQWVTVFLTLIVWLGYYCFRLGRAYDLKEVRQKRIQHWRDVFEEEWKRDDFVDSLLYSDMRPHLRQSTIDSIDGRMRVVIRSRAGSPDKTLLMDEISRIEKSWGLI